MESRSYLPLAYDDGPPTATGASRSRNGNGPITRTYLLIRRRPYRALLLLCLALLVLLNTTAIGTFRRDFIYLIRPLWDKPEPPFHVIPHYPPPLTGKRDWCRLHGWSARPLAAERPIVIDAIPVSTELDMLEIRMREYAPFVKIFIIVEAPMTHAGRKKPLFFAEQRDRFDKIAAEGGARIEYKLVEGMQADLPKGSFDNEIKQRTAIADTLNDLRRRGEIRDGSLVIQSDLDEIISRQTLDLLSSCTDYPTQMHLNVKNYRYSFNQPLLDEGYWRPRVVTVQPGQYISYHHGRATDWLLAGAGWHCSFCFASLDEMRAKMQGYVHNDRVRDNAIMEEKTLRGRVCSGEDPFGMYPEAFSFKDILAQSGPVKPSNAFLDLPDYLQKHPERFPYLLTEGCDRPNHPPFV